MTVPCPIGGAFGTRGLCALWGVFNEDLRALIFGAADLELTVSTRGSKNVPRYLLERIGLDGALIATNDTGSTKLLGVARRRRRCRPWLGRPAASPAAPSQPRRQRMMGMVG